MKSVIKNLVFAVFAAVSLASQAQSFGQLDVPSVQGRADLSTRQGVVIDIQTVVIEVQASPQARSIGALVGTLLGAALTRSQSSDWSVNAAGGAVGGVIGERIAANAVTERREAMQIVVMTEDKRLVTIVQEMKGATLQAGQRVFLVGSQPAVRVVPASSGML